jgi:hypothetical protein
MTPCLISRRHLTDGEHDGTPADHGYLCRSCTRRLEQRIAELPWVSGWLSQNLERGQLGSERLSGSRDAPIPLSITVLALLGQGHSCDEECHTSRCFGDAGCPGHHDPDGVDNLSLSIPGVIAGWVEIVLDQHPDRGLSGPEGTITACAAWLGVRLEWIVEQEWVDDMCREIDELVSRANAAVPWLPPPNREDYRPTPCEKCDKRALVWRYPWMECDGNVGGCNNLMSLKEYRDWTKQWIARWDKNRRALEVAV